MQTIREPHPEPRALNLTDDELAIAGDLLSGFLRSFEQSLAGRRVMPAIDRGQLQALFDKPFPEPGIGVEGLFQQISDIVVPNSTATAHPRFLAYVLGTPNGIAPYAEAIAAALNQNCNFWQLSPAASVIERKVIAWLGSLFEYPASGGGVLTSGGSMANLMAISAAMHAKAGIGLRQAGLTALRSPLIVYTSEEAHRSVEKGAAILGLGLDHIRRIPVDNEFRMRADLLDQAVQKDRRKGRTPFCVVAAAGTVNTGAIDPIDDIAEICQREDLWLHVDGAYGALFILCDSVRELLAACRRADSITLDPHKLLFAPLEAGCLLVRDREKLRAAFHFASSYLTVEEDPLLVNYLEYTPQLSRGFRAFKIWCALQMFGLSAFRAAAERTLRLSRYLAQRVAAEPSLEMLAPAPLTAVCFGFKAQRDDDLAVLARLVEEGAALLGPVRIHGRSSMRACIANYRTSERDIDLIIDRLLELAAAVRIRARR